MSREEKEPKQVEWNERSSGGGGAFIFMYECML